MDKKLGLGALISLVIGSMVGAGVFSLTQNIAAHASAGAVAPMPLFRAIAPAPSCLGLLSNTPTV